MKKVMVFGSFDVLHDGHRSLFKQAKRFGDFLVVVVARDLTYKDLRGFTALHPEQERLAAVAAEPEVDKALLGDTKDYYRVLRSERPAVICLGYDQNSFTVGLREKLDAMGLQQTIIERLEPFSPEKYKSSLLKKS